jgi:hypothetical protein
MPYDAHENKWDSPFGFRRKPPEEKHLKVCYKCLRDPPGESVPLFIVYLVRIFKIVSIITMIIYSGKLATICYDDINVFRLIIACLFSPFYIIYIFVTMPDKCLAAIPPFLLSAVAKAKL